MMTLWVAYRFAAAMMLVSLCPKKLTFTCKHTLLKDQVTAFLVKATLMDEGRTLSPQRNPKPKEDPARPATPRPASEATQNPTGKPGNIKGVL